MNSKAFCTRVPDSVHIYKHRRTARFPCWHLNFIWQDQQMKYVWLHTYVWNDVDPVFPAQHYRPQMFLDNLTSSMQSAAAASTSSALVSSSSHYDTSTHTASSIHETRVITGGGGGAAGGADSSISDIISLDWARGPFYQACFLWPF